MNRYYLKSAIKPISVLTALGTIMQIPFNVFATAAIDLNNTEPLLSGFGEPSRALFNTRQAGLASVLNEMARIKDVEEVLLDYRTSSPSFYDVSTIEEKSKLFSEQAKKLKAVVIDTSVEAVMNSAISKSSLKNIDSKIAKEVEGIVKAALLSSTNSLQDNLTIIGNARASKTSQNRFLKESVDSLISSAASGLTVASSGGSSEEIRVAVTKEITLLDKKVDAYNSALQAIDSNIADKSGVSPIVLETAAAQIAYNLFHGANVDKNQIVSIVDKLKILTPELDKIDASVLQKKLSSAGGDVSRLGVLKEPYSSSSSSSEEEPLFYKYEPHKRGINVPDIGDPSETIKAIIRTLNEQTYYDEQSGDEEIIRLNSIAQQLDSSSQDAKCTYEELQNYQKTMDVHSNENIVKYIEILIKFYKSKLSLLELQKQYNQVAQDYIISKINFSISVFDDKAKKQITDSVLKEKLPEFPKYNTDILEEEPFLQDNLGNANQQRVMYTLESVQDKYFNSTGDTSQLYLSELLTLQKDYFKCIAPNNLDGNPSLKQINDYKLYIQSELRYLQYQLKQNPGDVSLQTKYIRTYYLLQICDYKSQLFHLNEEKEYFSKNRKNSVKFASDLWSSCRSLLSLPQDLRCIKNYHIDDTKLRDTIREKLTGKYFVSKKNMDFVRDLYLLNLMLKTRIECFAGNPDTYIIETRLYDEDQINEQIKSLKTKSTSAQIVNISNEQLDQYKTDIISFLSDYAMYKSLSNPSIFVCSMIMPDVISSKFNSDFCHDIAKKIVSLEASLSSPQPFILSDPYKNQLISAISEKRCTLQKRKDQGTLPAEYSTSTIFGASISNDNFISSLYSCALAFLSTNLTEEREKFDITTESKAKFDEIYSQLKETKIAVEKIDTSKTNSTEITALMGIPFIQTSKNLESSELSPSSDDSSLGSFKKFPQSSLPNPNFNTIGASLVKEVIDFRNLYSRFTTKTSPQTLKLKLEKFFSEISNNDLISEITSLIESSPVTKYKAHFEVAGLINILTDILNQLKKSKPSIDTSYVLERINALRNLVSQLSKKPIFGASNPNHSVTTTPGAPPRSPFAQGKVPLSTTKKLEACDTAFPDLYNEPISHLSLEPDFSECSSLDEIIEELPKTINSKDKCKSYTESIFKKIFEKCPEILTNPTYSNALDTCRKYIFNGSNRPSSSQITIGTSSFEVNISKFFENEPFIKSLKSFATTQTDFWKKYDEFSVKTSDVEKTSLSNTLKNHALSLYNAYYELENAAITFVPYNPLPLSVDVSSKDSHTYATTGLDLTNSSEAKTIEYFSNIVDVYLIDTIINLIKSGQTTISNEFIQKLNEAKLAFESKDKAKIESCVKSTISLRLQYLKQYLPYWTAYNLSGVYFADSYSGEIPLVDRKKTVIVDYLYIKKAISPNLKQLPIINPTDIVKLIKSLSLKLYIDKKIPSEDFLLDVIYKDEDKTQLDDDFINQCNLLSSQMLTYEVADGKKPLVCEQVDDLIDLYIKGLDATDKNNFNKGIEAKQYEVQTIINSLSF